MSDNTPSDPTHNTSNKRDDNDHEGIDGEQPLMSHLIELRTRLLKSLCCVLIVFLALFSFANDIYRRQSIVWLRRR